MPRLTQASKPDYSLRRRFFTQIGEPLAWVDYGLGKFTDLETVQRQIKTLANVPRKVEIEFIRDGKMLGFDGKETGTTMIFEKR